VPTVDTSTAARGNTPPPIGRECVGISFCDSEVTAETDIAVDATLPPSANQSRSRSFFKRKRKAVPWKAEIAPPFVRCNPMDGEEAGRTRTPIGRR